jgi:translation initiation factor IF-3
MTNYRRKPKSAYNNQPQIEHAINQNIRHPEVRVISAEGDMMGILKTSEAIKMAFEKEMDLIEINPKGTPPVCKMMDYSKFKYQLSKAEATKPDAVKEKTLRMSVRIGPHDLEINAKKTDKFLLDKNTVKIQIRMRGREKSHPEITIEVMNQFLSMITESYDFISEPKLAGDSNIAVIKLGKKKVV